MAALFASIVKIGTYSFRYTMSGTPPFYIYWRGNLYLITSNTVFTLESNDQFEPEAAEIYDSTFTGVAEQILYPPFIQIVWRGNPNASMYRISQYQGAAWVEIGRVSENGSGYYAWASPCQTDDSTSQWKVVAYDSLANISFPILVNITHVRNPDPPSISMSYTQAGNLLTISAR